MSAVRNHGSAILLLPLLLLLLPPVVAWRHLPVKWKAIVGGNGPYLGPFSPVVDDAGHYAYGIGSTKNETGWDQLFLYQIDLRQNGTLVGRRVIGKPKNPDSNPNKYECNIVATHGSIVVVQEPYSIMAVSADDLQGTPLWTLTYKTHPSLAGLSCQKPQYLRGIFYTAAFKGSSAPSPVVIAINATSGNASEISLPSVFNVSDKHALLQAVASVSDDGMLAVCVSNAIINGDLQLGVYHPHNATWHHLDTHIGRGACTYDPPTQSLLVANDTSLWRVGASGEAWRSAVSMGCKADAWAVGGGVGTPQVGRFGGNIFVQCFGDPPASVYYLSLVQTYLDPTGNKVTYRDWTIGSWPFTLIENNTVLARMDSSGVTALNMSSLTWRRFLNDVLIKGSASAVGRYKDSHAKQAFVGIANTDEWAAGGNFLFGFDLDVIRNYTFAPPSYPPPNSPSRTIATVNYTILRCDGGERCQHQPCQAGRVVGTGHTPLGCVPSKYGYSTLAACNNGTGYQGVYYYFPNNANCEGFYSFSQGFYQGCSDVGNGNYTEYGPGHMCGP